MPAWSARLSSSIAPHYAVAIASSNLWPGAHTFTIGKYVGRHGRKTSWPWQGSDWQWLFHWRLIFDQNPGMFSKVLLLGGRCPQGCQGWKTQTRVIFSLALPSMQSMGNKKF